MLLSIVRPIAKLISKIHAPFSRKKINSKDYLYIRENMLPGDILLTRTHGEFGNFFITGMWKHAAIVGFEGQIIEATTSGVKSTHLFDFLRQKDIVRLVRPRATELLGTQAALIATKFVGSKYDFDFQSDDEEFYCSELISVAYKLAGKEIVKEYDRILPSELDTHPMIYDSRGIW